MSRKRAKSLKLDQVINLILDDTVSSSSSESEWNSDDQSGKYQHIQETENKKKCQSVTTSDDDDDDDVPLWKLANQSKYDRCRHRARTDAWHLLMPCGQGRVGKSLGKTSFPYFDQIFYGPSKSSGRSRRSRFPPANLSRIGSGGPDYIRHTLCSWHDCPRLP